MHRIRPLLTRSYRPGTLCGSAVTAVLVTLTLALAGCAQPHPASRGSQITGPAISGEPNRVVSGVLNGDPGTGCVWLGDRTDSPIELLLPATVTVAFAPTVTLQSSGKTLRAGQTVSAHVISAASSRPGCPLPDGHYVFKVERLLPGGRINHVPAPTTAHR